jgi:hypothetical protein
MSAKEEVLKAGAAVGAGAVVGAGAYGLIGGVGIVAGGAAFGITLLPAAVLGGSIFLVGRGVYRLGKWAGQRE